MRKVALMFCFGMMLVSLRSVAQSGPPPLCKPCFFYGGDFDGHDKDQEVFFNEYTLSYEANTYSAITIPKGRSALIEGILFQVMEVTPPNPKGAQWDIRVKVDQGGGGTSIASGQGPVIMQPTGRFFNQYYEYTTVVKINPAVQINGGNDFHGTRYWFNLAPVCENPTPACGSDQYVVSNTPHRANGFRAALQQGDEIFINFPQMGLNWENVCTAYGLGGNQCALLSFGLMGKIVQ